MSLSEIQFPEENPFYRIKVRQILLWVFVLLPLLLKVLHFIFFVTLAPLTKINFNKIPDFIVNAILVIFIVILLGALLIRQLNSIGIDIKRIIGKIPRSYKWLKLIGLVVARYAFFIGSYQIVYYFVSFFADSWVETKLKLSLSNNSFFPEILTTSLPIIYFLVYCIYTTLFIICFVFLTYGVALHRWSTKWGTKKTILYFCIFFWLLSSLSENYSLEIVLYTIVDILLYLQSRTLIVVSAAYIVDIILDLLWNYSGIIEYNLSLSLVEQLRDRVWIGVIFLILSTPILVRFIYQNWHRIDEPLPYFTNSSQ